MTRHFSLCVVSAVLFVIAVFTPTRARAEDLKLDRLPQIPCADLANLNLPGTTITPEDYDGINVGGSANFAQIHNRVQYVWNGQVTFGRGIPLASPTLAFINDAAVATWRALDGVVDRVIDDPLSWPFERRRAFCVSLLLLSLRGTICSL